MATSRAEQIKELERLLSKQERRIRNAFDEYVLRATDDATLKLIIDALMRNDVQAALDILNPHVISFSNSILYAFTDAGADMAVEIAAAIPAITASVGFDPSYPRAVEVMRAQKLNLIQQFTEQQRQVVRSLMTESFENGYGPRKVGSRLKESIGLTDSQMKAVANYRRLLEEGSSEALNRSLRDRRFDRSVERSASGGKPLSAEQIDKMVKRYYERYVAHRSETIARTEGVRATNAARMEAIQQAIDEYGIDPDSVQRIWNRTNDSRTRDWHRTMQGQKRGLYEQFEDGRGNKLQYPGDPLAPGETTINCRCVITIRQS